MGGRGSYMVFWAKQCKKTPPTTTTAAANHRSILKVKSRCRPALVCAQVLWTVAGDDVTEPES